MTVRTLAEKTGFRPVYLANPEIQVNGVYACDLLSWVLGNCDRDNVFVTIMTNANVVAVASLMEMSCVVFCENSSVSLEIIDLAKQKGVNLLSSPLPTYETCLKLGQILG